MSATAPVLEETLNLKTITDYGTCHEVHDSATTLATSMGAEATEGKARFDKTQVVCSACQHLYKNREIILEPSALCRDHNPVQEVSKENSRSVPSSQPKTWEARRYEGLCECAEAGRTCNCSASNHRSLNQYLQISAGTFWGPRVKKTLLVVAASIPFIFLIVYLVFTYK